MSLKDKNQKIIYIIAPHPDDESLACGGVIIKRIKEGCVVKVIVITDGSYSHFKYSYNKPNIKPEELIKIRINELKKATAILGVSSDNILLLNEKDGFLFTVKEILVDKLKKIFLTEENIVEIFAPHSKDSHPDHKSTNWAVNKAVESLKNKPQIYYYIVWGNNYNMTNKISIDISKYLSTKNRAIEQYKSQIDLIWGDMKKPILTSSFIRRFSDTTEETFWI